VSSLCKVIILGHLGADPELRTTASGEPVCNLRVATSESWTDAKGEKQERTEWHAITVFGRQAEPCGRFLAKGRQVFVEGRIQSRKYTDKDGIERRATEIIASNVLFVGEAGR
jgi:single-strand DNA-binding protein